MQYVSIAEFIYASYTDIRFLEADPELIAVCILARIGEVLAYRENILPVLAVSGIIFLVMMAGCIFFHMGGADALISLLICADLGTYGPYAVMTGLALALPAAGLRKEKEIPLIPFLSIGYMIWLLISCSI